MSDKLVNPSEPQSFFNDSETKALKAFWTQLFDLLGLSPANPSSSGSATKPTDQIHSIISSHGPERFAEAFWDFTMLDNPDYTVIKFIRARKLDVENALKMLLECLKWRIETGVDAIIAKGDLGFMAQPGNDGEVFKRQSSSGQTFLQGFHNHGGPVAYVFAKHYRAGEQSSKAMEDFIVYAMEIIRIFTANPKSKATVIVDLSGFSWINMDWKATLYFNKCLEAYYPEVDFDSSSILKSWETRPDYTDISFIKIRIQCLQSFIINNAPWMFQGIWKVLSPTLDPVVRSKILMAKSDQEILAHVDAKYLIKEFGGSTSWKWSYAIPNASPNLNENRKQELLSQRKSLLEGYIEATNQWLQDSSPTRIELRRYVSSMLRVNYLSLDPFIRGRTVYHEKQNIRTDGQIGFYSNQDSSSWEASSYSTCREELLKEIDELKNNFEMNGINYLKIDFEL